MSILLPVVVWGGSCNYGSIGAAPSHTPEAFRWGRCWGSPVQSPGSESGGQLSQTYVIRAIFPFGQVRGVPSSLILPHSGYWVQLSHWVWPPSHIHMQWVHAQLQLPAHVALPLAHVILHTCTCDSPHTTHAIPIPVLESPMPAHGVVLGVKALIWFINYCRLD